MKTLEVAGANEIYRNSLSLEENDSIFFPQRKAAYERFQVLGFPTRKLEGWKYISLEPVLKTPFVEAKSANLSEAARKKLDVFFAAMTERNRVVLIDGIYSKKYSTLKNLPSGVEVGGMSEILSKYPEKTSFLSRQTEEEKNAFVAINTFSFKEGVFIHIPDKCCLIEPIHLVFVSLGESGEPFAYYPRVLMIAGESVRASLIIHYEGLSSEKHLVNAVNEFYVGKNAHLECLQISRDRLAYAFSVNRFYLQAGSSVEASIFSQDGLLVRNESEAFLDEMNASASLKGLSVLKGASQVFSHTAAYHKAGSCRSRQFYKNILADSARSEFNSLVKVFVGAQKSDSKQLSKNLLLSDKAQAFARPQLNILADDVSCNHGATVGQLDEAELFYLRSRGLSEKAARFILIYGFAEEMLEEIREKHLREELERYVREELELMVKS